MILGFDGFRLVKETGSGVVTLDVPNGLVEREPNVKYAIQKTCVFDSTIILRRGPYNEDEINCVAIVTPTELKALEAFIRLSDGETMYILYDHDDETIHYPVTVDKYPKQNDDSRAFRQAVKMSFTALYRELPSLPDGYLSGIELEEGDGLFELEESNDKILLEEV